MPRYFFDLRDGEFIPDDTGAELAGLDEARVQAVMLAGALLKDNPGGQFWEGHDWNVEVRENAGPVLFTLTFFVTEAPSLRRRPAETASLVSA